jgi:hypothetical protein
MLSQVAKMSNTLRIRELNINQIIRPRSAAVDETGSKIVVIGKPGSGKSFLLRDLIYSKRHIFPVAEVISGTEDSNKFFQSIFPPSVIHDKLDTITVQNFIKRQKIAKEHLEWPWALLICDDCMDDPTLFRQQVFLNLFKNGRHWKLLFILGMQYAMDILPGLRICVDGAFVFRETNPANRKKLYENYCGVFGDYKLFCQVMDELTDDNTALYIDNRSTSNKIEDCVFWYKARDVGDFKFGCDDYWLFHESRFDENYPREF